MEKIQILVIGRNEEIVNTVIRLVNNNPQWNATPALTDEAALAVCNTQQFDLVLLGGGISPTEEHALRQQLALCQPNTRIIQHYGGGSGLLTTEINMALGGLQ